MTREESPYWIITYTLMVMALMLLIISIYSIFKINKTNKRLIKGIVHPTAYDSLKKDDKRLSKEEEKQLKHSGQMIRKIKGGWMYAPDKLERWLEGMEKEGYNLYRVNRIGTVFYF